jgi:hypothetical protein
MAAAAAASASAATPSEGEVLADPPLEADRI